jgi:hypothetical protein
MAIVIMTPVRTLKAARAFELDHPGLASPPGFSL